MTQHEYIFIAVSIILGLAITRLLNTMAILTWAYERVSFHWASMIWAYLALYLTALVGRLGTQRNRELEVSGLYRPRLRLILHLWCR